MDGTGTDLLTEAVERFEAAEERERATEAAIDLSRSFFFRGERDRAYGSIDRALALTEGMRDSPMRAKALVARSAYHMLASEHRQAIDLAREALPIVEELGLGPERARLLDVVGISRVLDGDAGGLSDSAQAIEVALEAGDLFEFMVATNNLANAQLYLGLIDEFDATMDAFRDRVVRFGTQGNRRWLASNESEAAYVHGRWDDALSLLDQDLARIDAGFPFYMEPSMRGRRALIRDARGDIEGALADSRQAVEVASTTKDAQLLVPALVTRARILAIAGDTEGAARLLSQVLEMGSSQLSRVQEENIGEGLISLAWLARDLDRADEVDAALATVVATPWIAAAAAVLHDDPLAGADALKRLRSQAAEAYTRLRAGRELIERGRTEEGHVQLRKALVFHRSVGATAYMREAEDLLAAPTATAD